MNEVTLDNLVFSFPDDWAVTKYDDWTFYKNRFQGALGGGVKAMDLLAIDEVSTMWLIEVKDYRRFPRSKVISLPSEVAEKAFDTLAGLLPAQVGSDEPTEMKFAKRAHRALRLRIVLHLEQPKKHSTLFPRAMNVVDIQQKLRTLVRAIDAHAIVCETSNLGKVNWSVNSVGATSSV